MAIRSRRRRYATTWCRPRVQALPCPNADGREPRVRRDAVASRGSAEPPVRRQCRGGGDRGAGTPGPRPRSGQSRNCRDRRAPREQRVPRLRRGRREAEQRRVRGHHRRRRQPPPVQELPDRRRIRPHPDVHRRPRHRPDLPLRRRRHRVGARQLPGPGGEQRVHQGPQHRHLRRIHHRPERRHTPLPARARRKHLRQRAVLPGRPHPGPVGRVDLHACLHHPAQHPGRVHPLRPAHPGDGRLPDHRAAHRRAGRPAAPADSTQQPGPPDAHPGNDERPDPVRGRPGQLVRDRVPQQHHTHRRTPHCW